MRLTSKQSGRIKMMVPIRRRYHGTTMKLNLGRLLADIVMNFADRYKSKDSKQQHEIDNMAAVAQLYILDVETRELSQED